jgi:hypothetical protein
MGIVGELGEGSVGIVVKLERRKEGRRRASSERGRREMWVTVFLCEPVLAASIAYRSLWIPCDAMSVSFSQTPCVCVCVCVSKVWSVWLEHRSDRLPNPSSTASTRSISTPFPPLVRSSPSIPLSCCAFVGTSCRPYPSLGVFCARTRRSPNQPSYIEHSRPSNP